MYEAGLLAEVTGLVQRYGVLSRTARKAIGYEEALLVMAGACTMEAGVEQTVLRTRRLAKRQRTWFRHQAEVRWVEVDPDAGVEETAGQVVAHWRQYGPTGVTI
jgi:tRNA dimethylallyltransferase